MPKDFKAISTLHITDNVFKLIGSDWMLITAGGIDSFNTMTASWGAFGELWNKKVCFCFVRPTRYTYEFMERSDCFTLSFFERKYREVLNLCGTKSGRDVNKVAETGLTPVVGKTGAVYFSEARLVLECKKTYFADLDPTHFLEPEIEEEYPKKDYHRMYIGEIAHCLTK
jgi:flavin reductase (DIM6/NTAB) family NADH-FMN oxidoreductase RutF